MNKRMNEMKRSLSFFLCMMLIVAMACITSGCGDNDKETPKTSKTETIVKGEGNTVFPFAVEDLEGTVTEYEIHTDKTTVGEALMELELLEGDMGEFGLYVTAVQNIPLDYEKDGAYWAFYVDGQYAMAGVDATPIVEGEKYSFKAEKA